MPLAGTSSKTFSTVPGNPLIRCSKLADQKTLKAKKLGLQGSVSLLFQISQMLIVSVSKIEAGKDHQLILTVCEVAVQPARSN